MAPPERSTGWHDAPASSADDAVGTPRSGGQRYAAAVLRDGDAGQPQEAGSRWKSYAVLGLLLLVIGTWFTLIRRFGEGDVYAVIGPYACAVSALMFALRPRALADWMRPGLRPILIGLGVGVAMTVLTYPVFQLGVWLFPELDGYVQALYRGARSTTLVKALIWVVAAATAEELLFRGVLPDVLARWTRKPAAYGVSLVVYALAQLGTGSLIVSLMALVCGAIWSVQRFWTGSLLSSLIAHLIWTPTVILLYPVT
jgi:membrane protease YdiL (CAAX protease family)